MRIAEKEPANKDPPLTPVEDPVVQANRFNDFYVSVKVAASAKAKALCHHNGFSVESIELVVPAADDLQNTNKFEFHAVTEQDTEKIVNHIPSNKAPGLDSRVSARVLKNSLPVTLPIITNLIITWFASNCFAQVWKSAVVIPNLKSWKHPSYIPLTDDVKGMREGCQHAVYGLLG